MQHSTSAMALIILTHTNGTQKWQTVMAAVTHDDLKQEKTSSSDSDQEESNEGHEGQEKSDKDHKEDQGDEVDKGARLAEDAQLLEEEYHMEPPWPPV
jgi:hypothetical protein